MRSWLPEALRDRTRLAGWLTSRRLFWPGGLSARLLLLTVLFVMLAEAMILGPSLASYEEGWLVDHVRAAELATVAVEASPAGVVSDRVANELLKGAGVVTVALQSRGVRRLLPPPPWAPMSRTPELIDLRRRNGAEWLASPFRTLGPFSPPFLRVQAKPQFREADFVEIVVPTAPLRHDLVTYLLQLLAVTAFISAVAGILVYFSLATFLVRPMRRITESMERFREHPEDPAARLVLSGRRDEIGRAETELSRMQDELRTALQSQARLAQLGQAVAKINHDLRNMLTSAQMASERIAGSGDPRVAQALPRLERALNRAVKLAEDVLAYGSSDEAAPQVRSVDLAVAADVAAEDARLTPEAVALVIALPKKFALSADPDQFHRILVNLFRNAREAMEGNGRNTGEVRLTAERKEGRAIVRITDNGPGVPERARDRLFEPFVGSGRPGGAGLGLAIARDLVRGHGGELSLAETGPSGAVFELVMPDMPSETDA